ncbi:uncharacterized protein LOC128960407 [Oppia nitens]|uniref:uncharacterized protein LOC128960407 n=1 Tax=Oppia nitens TaxID=1686743 RepID=UPI0023DBCEF7|nr:uncharacterized protein LOC128960407 [Oppia nitens]
MNNLMTTTTTRKGDSFERFGDDLAQLLVSYLPIDSRLRLECVSKQFQYVIYNTQDYILWDNTQIANPCRHFNCSQCLSIGFEKILKKCPYIKYIKFNGMDAIMFTDHYLYLMIANCPYLKCLTIKLKQSMAYTSLTSYMFSQFLIRFAGQLQSISIFGFNHIFNELLSYLDISYAPNLRNVYLECDDKDYFIELNRIYYSTNVNTLPKTLDSLAFVVQHESVQLFQTFAANYGQQIKCLQILIGGRFIRQYMNQLKSGFSQMNELTHLNLIIDTSDEINDEDEDEDENEDLCISELLVALVQQIAKSCAKLTTLKIKSYNNEDICKGTVWILIEIICHKMNQLNSLSIECPVNSLNNDIYLMTSKSLSQLKHLRQLRLEFSGAVIINDEFFTNIDHHLPQLQLIDIKEPFDISSETIKSLAKLRHLNTIRLYSSANEDIDEDLIISELIDRANVTNIYITRLGSTNGFIRGKQI